MALLLPFGFSPAFHASFAGANQSHPPADRRDPSPPLPRRIRGDRGAQVAPKSDIRQIEN
jgi:hypothetical protein